MLAEQVGFFAHCSKRPRVLRRASSRISSTSGISHYFQRTDLRAKGKMPCPRRARISRRRTLASSRHPRPRCRVTAMRSTSVSEPDNRIGKCRVSACADDHGVPVCTAKHLSYVTHNHEIVEFANSFHAPMSLFTVTAPPCPRWRERRTPTSSPVTSGADPLMQQATKRDRPRRLESVGLAPMDSLPKPAKLSC